MNIFMYTFNYKTGIEEWTSSSYYPMSTIINKCQPRFAYNLQISIPQRIILKQIAQNIFCLIRHDRKMTIVRQVSFHGFFVGHIWHF